jgi:hypothetical protein
MKRLELSATEDGGVLIQEFDGWGRPWPGFICVPFAVVSPGTVSCYFHRGAVDILSLRVVA